MTHKLDLHDIDYILMDVFDTILTRKVHPEYIKKLTSKKLKLFFNLPLTVDEIYSIRNNLERKLCESNQKNQNDLEFNFKDFSTYFYNELSQKIDAMKKIKIEEFKVMCEIIEINTELSHLVVEQDTLETLKIIHKQNLPISCVSDFYLPKDMLKTILVKYNLDAFFDEIFVSSDFLLTKRTGRLYDTVIQKLKINPARTLMLGDNRHSDYDPAIKKGLKCYLIDRNSHKKFYDVFLSNANDLKKTTNNMEKITMVQNHETRFDMLVFSLFHFIQKLHFTLLNKRVKNVFFVSKEGIFLNKLFDFYQHSQGYDSDFLIKSYHLPVSRKSTYLPSLKSLSEEKFEILFRQYRKISLKDFLLSLNMEDKDIVLIASNLKVDENKINEDLPTSDIFRNLINDNYFIDWYEKNRLLQKTNLQQYLDSFSVDYKTEGLHLADVGWKGTIQDNIFNVFNQDIKISGYYLGLILPGNATGNNTKEGILFSAVPNKTAYYDVYSANCPMFEIFCGSSTGSADRYLKDKSGSIKVIIQQDENEYQIFNNLIEPIQQLIHDRFKELCQLFNSTHFSYDSFEHFFAEKHSQLVFFPTKNEIDFFKKLSHVENFGIFKVNKIESNDNITISKKLKNLINLFSNPYKAIGESWWIPASLDNLGLSFLSPVYGKIMCDLNFNKNTFTSSLIHKFILSRKK